MMAARPAGPGLLPGGLAAGGPPPGSIPVSMAGIPVSGKYNFCILVMEQRTCPEGEGGREGDERKRNGD